MSRQTLQLLTETIMIGSLFSHLDGNTTADVSIDKKYSHPEWDPGQKQTEMERVKGNASYGIFLWGKPFRH